MKLTFACLLLSCLASCAGLDVRGTLLLPGGSVSYHRDGKTSVVGINLDGKQVIDLR